MGPFLARDLSLLLLYDALLIPGFGFRDSRFWIRDSGFEIRVSGFGIRVSSFGFRVQAASLSHRECL